MTTDGKRWLFVALLFVALRARADDSAFQWNGFAAIRLASTPEDGPLDTGSLNSQLQLGLDWLPSPRLGAHASLLARSDASEGERNNAGVVEAYADVKFAPHGDRVRLRGGAFFLPTSRENIDELWQPAYTLTPSVLNSWLGEESRPVGVDLSYRHRQLFAGATIFRGNDTFGALPAVRGWRMTDHWAVLGERVQVDEEYQSSVSAESDGRAGWSARGGWSNERALFQWTHFDNRSDALDHGRLFDWATRLDVVAAEYSSGDWTVAAENGWGPTSILVSETRYTTRLDAGYLLVSRRMGRAQVTLRGDRVTGGAVAGHALTGAVLWNLHGPFRLGAEATAWGNERRLALDFRYYFARR